jgi:secreted Zn-dependent insulinase-like peptidase
LKKSPNDAKHYRPITLQNGLRVLVIQNMASDKAAAALAVNAGHFDDPKDRQGLAHFLEHMLFLGTEKYPDGSEYQQFISQHGGNHNAWTATEHTCFFFDIHHAYFEKALDRFSQFFISPLLSEQLIASERQNIDAEFKLKLKDDIRRLYDVHKETVNPKHPFSQFSVGNIETLKDRANGSIKSELSHFFNTFYCANYMTLVIEGPQPIEQLQALAISYFSAIKTSNMAKAPLTEPLYKKEHLAIQLNITPIKNEKKLILSFAMPAIDHLYRYKPESILSYLLGHEGKGSILANLKQKQWAIALSAGSGINGSNFKDFNIALTLTEQGQEHIDEIVSLIFNYIELLKKSPLPTYFYEEKRSLAQLSFHYHETTTPLESASQLVINMQHYPEEDYIYGDYVMAGFNQKHIDQLLHFFSPENMRLIHINQQHDKPTDKISRWYNVPYHYVRFTQQRLNAWKKTNNKISSLALPNKNIYLSANPNVLKVEEHTQIPCHLVKDNGFNLWFKQDSTFRVPKGHIYVGIDSPFAVASIKNIAMTRLFVELFRDTVTEEFYDAELAGIHYHLYAHQGGVTLQLAGLSEKQPQLLALLLNKLQHLNLEQARFSLFKKQLLTHLNNASKSKSIAQLFSKLSSALQPQNPCNEDLACSLNTVDFKTFIRFCATLFQQISISSLVHGNWHKSHALAIAEIIKTSFVNRFNKAFSVDCPVASIDKQGEMIYPIYLPEHDHACVIYYPFANRSLITTASTMLLSQLLSPHFFQQMRTEKQYGYLVGVGYIPINRYPGLAFYIQSPHCDALLLRNEIDVFIKQAITIVNTTTTENWQHIKAGLASQLQEKDTCLGLKSQRFWGAICNDDNQFNQTEALIDTILASSLADLKTTFIEQLTNSKIKDRITLISLKNKKKRSKNKNLSYKICSYHDFLQLKAL